ncbi:hypothetical protein MCOR02_012247 [Pyricularia oryzae]|uniref:Uncharacterized protein n=1 Tax=Pyricularia oryzae (strain 70-15 / ATCC MYA-4617 / FGSC 8958) TaxID=242507 RepID=G4NA33_PYRO7|nr:uncharacterized protein MGG_17273 [Pyricularia oryzae 70-15]EHA51279.1 hypothetical protein MGG_17273 [Pyricularia oryzae 70-15]KAH9427341.1 hypothetical protein MCOR02_012247 [Pyricularia oryzae]
MAGNCSIVKPLICWPLAKGGTVVITKWAGMGPWEGTRLKVQGPGSRVDRTGKVPLLLLNPRGRHGFPSPAALADTRKAKIQVKTSLPKRIESKGLVKRPVAAESARLPPSGNGGA